MNKIEQNIVLRSLAGEYSVLYNGQIVSAKARGKLKSDGVLTGDYVSVEKDEYSNGQYVITAVKRRRNMITRPRVANIDQLVIVLSIKPAPDFYLIDKLLINCLALDVEPLLVVNKEDISSESFVKDVVSQYKNVADVLCCSGKTGQGISELKNKLSGKLSVFAGQSAVGKSTLLNALSPELKLTTGGLSEKTDRGRHTTRECQIYLVDDMMIADTPGFSMLDLDIDPKELSSYFVDFDKYRGNCRYTDCSHINVDSKECGVKKAVEEGLISPKRYERYIELYKEIKKAWDNKF